MKKIYLIVLSVFVLVVLAGAGVYWYAFLRTHKSMLKIKPAYTLNSEQLLSEFTTDENAAFEKYAGKVIEVTGKIEDINRSEKQTAIIFEDRFFGVSAYLDSSFLAKNRKIIDALNHDQQITVRGQCDGMLSDVIISRAVIID
jgi:hypothetical protein